MNQSKEIVRVNELRGFKDGQRVSAQDVQASPVQYHTGTISSVWDDGTAIITWDDNRINLDRDSHLVVNGYVELHHLVRIDASGNPI